jgi:sulfur-oxidizing protein SoxY
VRTQMKPTRRHLLGRLAAIATMPLTARLFGGVPAAQAAIAPDGVTRFVSIEEDFPGTMKRLFGDRTIEYNKTVSLTAPQMAENGRVVPVEVKFDYASESTAEVYPEHLFVIVENNRRPLSLVFAFSRVTATGFAACNLRMGATSPVRAIVEMSDGRLVGVVKNVNVVVGGCGG